MAPKRSEAMALVALLTTALFSPSRAAARITRPVGFATSVGYSYPGQSGFGLTGGAWIHFSPVLIFATLDTTLVSGPPNERYVSETTSDGRTICRELATGHFATKSKCGSGRTLIAGMAEAQISPISQLFLGAGVRSPPAPGPYVAISYVNDDISAFQFWFVRAAYGKDFAQLHFGLGF
jgi:hypothetical protein